MAFIFYSSTHFSRTKWVKADGVEFKKGAGIVFGMKNDLPQVGQITSVYVINGGTVLFRATPFTSSWLPHFRGYTLHEQPHVHEKLLYMSQFYILLYIFVDHKPFLLVNYSLLYLIMFMNIN